MKQMSDMGKEEDKQKLSTIAADAAAMTILQQTGSNVPDLFTRDILLMHTMVNGAMHVRNIHKLASMLKPGDHVKLVLEPDNPADSKAILVRNDKGKKLGYIPRAKNEVLFHLLDSGKYLYGIVTGDDIGENLDKDDPWVEIYIDVYMKD